MARMTGNMRRDAEAMMFRALRASDVFGAERFGPRERINFDYEGLARYTEAVMNEAARMMIDHLHEERGLGRPGTLRSDQILRGYEEMRRATGLAEGYRTEGLGSVPRTPPPPAVPQVDLTKIVGSNWADGEEPKKLT